MSDLTQDQLNEQLNYCPETGIFTWRYDAARNVKTGDVAGYKDRRGRIIIKIAGKNRYAHRLAWLCMTGKYPKNQIDHINRDQSDNKWLNLRDVTSRTNCENRSTNCRFIGVYRHKMTGKWCVFSPTISGHKKYIGVYKTHLAACYARHSWEINHA